MTDRTAKMLERVRALLAKADSTPFTGEADVFRAKADELMTQYAIDQWMVNEAQDASTARPKPEIRYVDSNWWYDSSHYIKLWSLFSSCARHCRVVIAQRGWVGGRQNGMPVIGLASDIDYLDMLFTHLMLQMGKQLEPDVDRHLEPGHNVYRLRQAGLPWPRITEKMFKAGLVKPTPAQITKFYVMDDYHDAGSVQEAWEFIPERLRTELKNKLANWNRAYVKENGLQGERNYIRPAIYQDGFAEGFVAEVAARFREMREQQERKYDETHEAGSMSLVVRDIYDQALDLYREKWPPPPPPPPPDPNAPKRRVSRTVARERAFSWDAYNQGKAAGAKADISARPGQRLSNTKEIDE